MVISFWFIPTDASPYTLDVECVGPGLLGEVIQETRAHQGHECEWSASYCGERGAWVYAQGACPPWAEDQAQPRVEWWRDSCPVEAHYWAQFNG